jgi:hypothetical protein
MENFHYRVNVSDVSLPEERYSDETQLLFVRERLVGWNGVRKVLSQRCPGQDFFLANAIILEQ